MPTFRSQMPSSVNLKLLFDRSEPVLESVNDVKFTLLLTVALVVLGGVIGRAAFGPGRVTWHRVQDSCPFSQDQTSAFALP